METNYIYQTIHTVGYSPLYLDRHCRVLEEAFMELYMRPLHLNEVLIAQEIWDLLESQSLTTELSIFVDLRISSSGEHSILVDSLSLYDGYSLRAITPRAVLVDFASPFGYLPTKARRATIAQANEVAKNLGGELAVEYYDNTLHSIGGSPLFIVSGRTITTPPTFDSVERGVIIDAAQRSGVIVEQREIRVDELFECEELLIADHYGLTAISHFEHRPYTNTIAIKIAELISQPF